MKNRKPIVDYIHQPTQDQQTIAFLKFMDGLMNDVERWNERLVALTERVKKLEEKVK